MKIPKMRKEENMKRKILSIVMIFAICLSVGCAKKSETDNSKANSEKSEISREDKSKEDENADEQSGKSDVNGQKTSDEGREADQEEIGGIYSDGSVAVFSDEIFAKDVEKYIQENKIEMEKGEIFTVKLSGGKISELRQVESMTIEGKYVGLVDSSVAEFAVGDAVFRLQISQDQAEGLENLKENQLLSLIIRGSDDWSNPWLSNFSVK